MNEIAARTGPQPLNLAAGLHHVPWAGTVVLAIVTFYALPWGLGLSALSIAVCGTLLLAVAWVVLRKLPDGAVRPDASQRWFVIIVAVGVVLRIVWVFAMPPVQTSDMNEYGLLARALLNGEGYHQFVGRHDLLAYRAPGYPFLLAGAMAAIGDHWWTPTVLNLIFVVATAWLMNDLARRLWGGAAGIFATALFMAWPSGFMTTGLAQTEFPSLFLLILVGWAIVRARSDRRSAWWLATGLGIGIGALVRPSILLLPVLLLILAGMSSQDRALELRHVGLALLVAALCIAPWTLRNYMRLGAPVLISTNGGDNLYRANNPLASGGFTPFGEKDLSGYLPDEVQWNRASMDAAKTWIRENPLAFARLAARKLAISFADDSTGAYWSILRAHRVDGAAYVLAIVVSNIWWVAVWVLTLVALIRHRAALVDNRDGALMLWLLVLLPTVHAVFESQPRYHMPIIGVLLCIPAVLGGSFRGTRASTRIDNQ